MKNYIKYALICLTTCLLGGCRGSVNENISNSTQKMCDSLQNVIQIQSSEIERLNAQVKNLTPEHYTIRINNKTTLLDKLIMIADQPVKHLEKHIQLAYYTVGSTYNLRRKDIIFRSFPVFGSLKINHECSINKFETVDANKRTSIPINASGIDIISVHPKGSYRLVYDKQRTMFCKELRVMNPALFWSETKILVVSHNF